MWRFLQSVPRVIRQQWNTSVRTAPQTVYCEDEPDRVRQTELDNRICLPTLHKYNILEKWQLDRESRGSRKSGSGQTQSHSGWTASNQQNGIIEAVGWGAAIVLGLQLSKLYHLRHDRRIQHSRSDDNCPVQWLQRFASVTQGIQVTTSYISDEKPQSPQDILIQYDAPNEECRIQAECHEVLDHESLLDIEVKSDFQFSSSLFQNRSLSEEQSLCFDALDVHAAMHDEKPDSTEPVKSTPVEVAGSGIDEAVRELCTLASRCSAQIHHDLALRYLKAGRHQGAFSHWQQACQEGDAKAHFNVALCYETGKGTSKDVTKAAEHYTKAAVLGHPVAMYNLAVYHLHGTGGVEKNVSMAMDLMEKAALKGLAQAETNLGVLMTDDTGDLHRAVQLFSSAAEKNDLAAQYYLGVCYENGWGVQQDLILAAKLYSSAASAGHPAALHNLAVFTETGTGGLMVDRRAACDLYRRAKLAGNQASALELQRLTSQLNTEQFQHGYSSSNHHTSVPNGTRRTKSSPALAQCLSHYIHKNLLDFGLDYSGGRWVLREPLALADQGALPRRASMGTTPAQQTQGSFNMTSPGTHGEDSQAVSFQLGDDELEEEETTVRPQPAPPWVPAGGFGDVPLRSHAKAPVTKTVLSGGFGQVQHRHCPPAKTLEPLITDGDDSLMEMRLVLCS